jgi:hypothetical protein
MTEIARLSDQTTIERDAHGTAWIVTSDLVVAAQWIATRFGECRIRDGERKGDSYDWYNSDRWRILLLDAWRECYKYRDGEPWCRPSGSTIICSSNSEPPIVAFGTVYPYTKELHVINADAAKLCGYSADSLRTFIAAVSEEET